MPGPGGRGRPRRGRGASCASWPRTWRRGAAGSSCARSPAAGAWPRTPRPPPYVEQFVLSNRQARLSQGLAGDAGDRGLQAARHPPPGLGDPRGELRRRPARPAGPRPRSRSRAATTARAGAVLYGTTAEFLERLGLASTRTSRRSRRSSAGRGGGRRSTREPTTLAGSVAAPDGPDAGDPPS